MDEYITVPDSCFILAIASIILSGIQQYQNGALCKPY